MEHPTEVVLLSQDSPKLDPNEVIDPSDGDKTRKNSHESEITSKVKPSRISRAGARCRDPLCCAVSSSAIAVTILILIWTGPMLYRSILNHQLTLQPGTTTHNYWLKSPAPMYMHVYLFNMTNAQDVVDNQTKPFLQQLGPYTFEERHERVNVEYFDNFTLKFQQKRTWHFIADMSNGNLDDRVVTLNVPVVAAAHILRFKGKWLKWSLNKFLGFMNAQLFIAKTSGQLLFDGYEDPILGYGSKFKFSDAPAWDKFGWFYQRNGSDSHDGVFNVFTGSDDINKVAVMDMWNGARRTKYDGHCGMVNGSFGEGWPPGLNRTSISIFMPDACRTVTLDYVEDVQSKQLLSYRFAGSRRTFENASQNADNWCFDVGGVSNPSGIFNVSVCRYGAPAFISFPHFYLADPYYLNQVDGLLPNKDRHQFHIDLEPEMSVPSSVRARLQINVLVEPDADISAVSLDLVDRMFLPVLWFEVGADLPDSLATRVNLSLKISEAGRPFMYGLLCTSLVSITIALVRFRGRSRHQVSNVVLKMQSSEYLD